MASKLSSLAGYDSPSDGEGEEVTRSPSAIDNISGSDGEDTRDSLPVREVIEIKQRSENTPTPPPKKVSRLVSYYGDDLEDDEEESTAKEAPALSGLLNVADYGDSFTSELASSISTSMLAAQDDGLQIPPEPPGRCSKHLQDKIATFYNKKMDHGLDLNSSIQKRKDFRNPSIYEKLIEFCNIDEKGTNYPVNMFDPHCWDKSSFYDELARAQKIEMDKREKERKDRTKVEFVTGTAKKSDSSESEKRKTKWDSQPQGGAPRQITIPPPSVVTTSASKNQISALGSIAKKK